jgi:hypothetical protein
MKESDFQIVDRVSFILDRCRGKKVLHLGCANYPYTHETVADGSLLHPKLAAVCGELHGFDHDVEGIKALEGYGYGNLSRCDLERLEEVEKDDVFEVIIAGEIIEHLSNPGLFLNGIKRFMHAETELVITTINAYGAMRFAQYGLRGRNGAAEPVHPDHVAYYSYRTLTLAVARAGLNVEEFAFYDLGPEHRRYCRWYYRAVNDLSVAVSKQLSDGVIAVCRLGE